MIVIRQNEDTIEQGIVATIGFFDGVHVGHRFLIKELQDWGKELNMPSAVITFPEHPRQVRLPSEIVRYFPREDGTFGDYRH